MSRASPLPCSRRSFLGVTGALFASGLIPRVASAAGARDPRFVCIVLRGALDGLAAVAPLGDPQYTALRGSIALTKDGPRRPHALDDMFWLHPSLTNVARLYGSSQALVVHAAATNYRARSHFDGQDVLESGQPGPSRTESGWLNRASAAIPSADRARGRSTLGVGPTAPLIVRGSAPVVGWAPSRYPTADEDTAQRVLALYAESDPTLGAALEAGLGVARKAAGQPRRRSSAMALACEGAAAILAADDGPRLAALAFDGWDTHAREGGATGALANRLAEFDEAIGTFERQMGPKWKDTVVLVVTEFGRTARINGTMGTDHGQASVAFLLGGAVKGGHVLADWPGLGEAALYEGRDLTPTTDVRGIAKGVLQGLYDISERDLATTVFPESAQVRPLPDLIT